MTTADTTTRLEVAAEAIRQHLHERPWSDDPAAVYAALGDVQDIARRLMNVVEQAAAVIRDATAADDGRAPTHMADADNALWRALDHLTYVAEQIGDAHNAAGHLIWPTR